MSADQKVMYKKGVSVGEVEEFAVSSRELIIAPDQLTAAGVKATDAPSRMIDDGTRGWHDWYMLNNDHAPLWIVYTRKLKDPKWRGPYGAKLVFDMTSETDNTVFVSLTCNDWGSFEPGKPTTHWTAVKQVTGSNSPQTISVALDDMINTDPKTTGRLANWQTVTEMSISPSGDTVKDGQKTHVEGKPWKGSRQVLNLHWEGAGETKSSSTNTAEPSTAPADMQQRRFNEAIQKSLEQEKRDQTGK